MNDGLKKLSPRLAVILRRTLREQRKSEEKLKYNLLRKDLNDGDYARWLFSEKFKRGTINPEHAMNDFALFRIAFEWPKDANWVLQECDLERADFSLTDQQAEWLIEMAQEGLTDGYVNADWFARVAAVWHADKLLRMPQALFSHMEAHLFGAIQKKRGRKRSHGIDRDRIIRNCFEGLIARGSNQDSAYRAIANSLFMEPDAVRKIVDRTPRTEREQKLWAALNVMLMNKGTTSER